MATDTQRVDIPGVGTVDVPTFPTPDDFPNLYMTREEICLKLFDLERRVAQLEEERNAE